MTVLVGDSDDEVADEEDELECEDDDGAVQCSSYLQFCPGISLMGQNFTS